MGTTPPGATRPWPPPDGLGPALGLIAEAGVDDFGFLGGRPTGRLSRWPIRRCSTWLAGKRIAEQLPGWSVDTTTGFVTFSTPPALEVEVTADFEFDVPVRFDTDHMAVTIESYRLHNWQPDPDRRAEGITPHEEHIVKVSASTFRSRKRLGADHGVQWHGHEESLAGGRNRLIPDLEFCSPSRPTHA